MSGATKIDKCFVKWITTLTADLLSISPSSATVPELLSGGSGLLLPQIPEAEEAFWHTHYTLEPYFVAGRGFDQYAPAYQLGWQAGYEQASGQAGLLNFESQENVLRTRWLHTHGCSLLDWAQVKAAIKAAYSRAVAPQKMEAQPKSLGGSAQMELVLVLQAGQSFAESSNSFLRTADPSMANDVLRRCSHDSHKLVVELEGLVDGTPLQEPAAKDQSGLLQRARSAWADYLGTAAAETLSGVLQRLQIWLERTEHIAQQVLPSDVAKLLKHHVMVLRGHIEALQWLSRVPA